MADHLVDCNAAAAAASVALEEAALIGGEAGGGLDLSLFVLVRSQPPNGGHAAGLCRVGAHPTHGPLVQVLLLVLVVVLVDAKGVVVAPICMLAQQP